MARLDTNSEQCFLHGKHANDTGGDFVMNYGLVIFPDDVDTKFLFEEIENGRTKEGDSGGKVGVERRRRTTMSPVLSWRAPTQRPLRWAVRY